MHSLTPEGQMSEARETEGKDGIVRELDVDALMSRQTAIEIRDWLSARIKESEQFEILLQKDKMGKQ
jgi:hypothetical protein